MISHLFELGECFDRPTSRLALIRETTTVQRESMSNIFEHSSTRSAAEDLFNSNVLFVYIAIGCLLNIITLFDAYNSIIPRNIAVRLIARHRRKSSHTIMFVDNINLINEKKKNE